VACLPQADIPAGLSL
jgi:toxin HigB-1